MRFEANPRNHPPLPALGMVLPSGYRFLGVGYIVLPPGYMVLGVGYTVSPPSNKVLGAGYRFYPSGYSNRPQKCCNRRVGSSREGYFIATGHQN